MDDSAEPTEEEKFLKKYGQLPTKKSIVQKRLKGGDKQYFDSADWATEKNKPTAAEEGPSTTPPPKSGEVSLDQTSLPPEPQRAS
mmetsp:Transcript_36151/g.77107  ORF Transcript_36151/g.77107 Transcript_36151/m.77107 type:complete len:85 (+) Transcript_36151:154-408(+)|eukprot:CAMPEP_0183343086 /NCGR_PEP_ID=MMETSP0164_2-20130417/9061_1 /TAXON_ID=221442 /ORGANISM="Coccolithus pelagicus ssp braarudi, Strain PLY182g" /LENGTH=84 /DNA_ID=CAMNT_0025513835 /DNA_START=148 /DNA_END=402 /DNA_ORIENTATION=-